MQSYIQAKEMREMITDITTPQFNINNVPAEQRVDIELGGCDTAEVLIWDEAGRFAPNGSGASLFETAPWNDETEEYDFDWLNANQGGHNDQVFGHCSSECVARMIGTLVNCGDSDPRPAIVQIYNASFNNKG